MNQPPATVNPTYGNLVSCSRYIVYSVKYCVLGRYIQAVIIVSFINWKPYIINKSSKLMREQ